jgi:hypothetical protein
LNAYDEGDDGISKIGPPNEPITIVEYITHTCRILRNETRIMPQPITACILNSQSHSLSTIFDHISSRAKAWIMLISVSSTVGK